MQEGRRVSRSVASAPLHEQSAYLEATLRENDVAQAVLAVAQELDLRDWYFGAGGVAQTVWNVLHGFEASAVIKDYDLVYFDAADLRIETESEIEAEVADRLRGDGIVVDVKNEARVHLWYERRFGRHLEPYRSTGDAIATWPTTASSVGVRYDGHTFVVCAPFGLADLFSMVARRQQDDRDQRRLRGEGRPLGRTMAPTHGHPLVTHRAGVRGRPERRCLRMMLDRLGTRADTRCNARS